MPIREGPACAGSVRKTRRLAALTLSLGLTIAAIIGAVRAILSAYERRPL
jgi:hypothetical protein